MRTPRLLPALLVAGSLLSAAACGDSAAPSGGDDETARPNAAQLPSGTQLHLVLTTQVTIHEFDVHDEGPGDTKRESAAVRSEWWLTADGTFVEERDEEGLRLATVIRGDEAWRRVGAVTADVITVDRPSVLAPVEDLVCLLGWEDSWPHLVRGERVPDSGALVVSGAARPQRHVSLDAESGRATGVACYPAVARDDGSLGNPLAEITVSGWSPVQDAPGLEAPTSILRAVPGPGTLTETRITIESAAAVTGEAARTPVRPTRPAPEFGEPTRGERRAANVVVSEHGGPLSDVPRLLEYAQRGLRTAQASPRGPFGLEIDRLPSAERYPAVRIVVPVSLSQGRDAADLPAGLMTRADSGTEVVTVPCRGALPSSQADLEPALAAARDLGLEPVGPVRILLQDDLATGDPASLSFEIEVPVRERD